MLHVICALTVSVSDSWKSDKWALMEEDFTMSDNTYITKDYIGKDTPKIIDAVRFNNRYIDSDTFKEKAAGIISGLMILAGIVAFSFLILT